MIQNYEQMDIPAGTAVYKQVDEFPYLLDSKVRVGILPNGDAIYCHPDNAPVIVGSGGIHILEGWSK